ncbi:hypothetical protein HDU77_010647 [Chytriomyces hyalinus]|nr:hypothetical protein HDU77_010647 [Chytriomyces hyalinus]
MASRSKTLIFVQFRATFAREHTAARRDRAKAQRQTATGDDEAQGLIDNDGDVVVEMAAIPPKWVDIVDEVDQDIIRIKAKISELEQMHKKHLLPGFGDDRISNELNIERFAEQITNMFRAAQRKIKKIEQESNRNKDVKQSAAFGRNIQMGLAAKLQDVSGIFRKAQSAYLNKLRGRETRSKDMFQSSIPTRDGSEDADDEDLDAVFTDAQMATVQNNERAISEREKEINEIVKSINGLAEIFKELQTMVIDQGTVLDRIDYNIEQTGVYMEEAHVQLQQGAKYQEKTKAKLCIILLALIVFILVVIIFYKVDANLHMFEISNKSAATMGAVADSSTYPQNTTTADSVAEYTGCFQGKSAGNTNPYRMPFSTMLDCMNFCHQPGVDNPFFFMVYRDPLQAEPRWCACSSQCSLVQVGPRLLQVSDVFCTSGCPDSGNPLCDGFDPASIVFSVYSIREGAKSCGKLEMTTPMNQSTLLAYYSAIGITSAVLFALVYFLILESKSPLPAVTATIMPSPFNLQLLVMAFSLLSFYACVTYEISLLTPISVHLTPLNYFFSATFKTFYLLHSWRRGSYVINSVAPTTINYFRFLIRAAPAFMYAVTIPAIVFAWTFLNPLEELRGIPQMAQQWTRIIETASLILMALVDVGLLTCFILHIVRNTRSSNEQPIEPKFLTICYFGIATNTLCMGAFVGHVVWYVTKVSVSRFPVHQGELDAVTHMVFTAVLVALFAMKILLWNEDRKETSTRRMTMDLDFLQLSQVPGSTLSASSKG